MYYEGQEVEISYLEVANSISFLQHKVESQGIKFYEGRDVSILENIIAPTNKELTVLLSRRGNLYQPGDMFFILGCCEDSNEPACLVAGRRDRFSGWTLARYLEEYVPKVMTFSNSKPAKLASKQDPCWDIKPSNPAYLCELWTHPKFRSRGIAQSMVKMGQLYAFLFWRPDLIWALMSDEDVAVKNLGTKYGFTQLHEDALRWDLPPREIPEKVWYVANSPVHLVSLVRRIEQERRTLQQERMAPKNPAQAEQEQSVESIVSTHDRRSAEG